MAKNVKRRAKSAPAVVDVDELLRNERIVERDVGAEIEQSMLDYAVMTILSRALPDGRDGLKPVQRRILFGAQTGGFTSGKKFFKCARVVGDVMGRYHPQGDQGVYDALVHLAQGWYERYPLMDFQGNVGSMDGDDPAAMRYSETRLTRFAEEVVLEDVAKGECVDFHPTYSDDDVEPDALPSLLPNLLVNGSYGIAVGCTTNVPSHNIADAARAIELVVDHPEATDEQLMAAIQGPDVPLGGLLLRDDGLRQLYTTGKGSLTFRAMHVVETDPRTGAPLIVFTSLPPMVNKAKLKDAIEDMVYAKTLPRVLSVRDESQGMDIRLVVVCQKTARVNEVLNDLFNMRGGGTDKLQKSVTYLVRAVVDGRPELMSLRRVIDVYLAHRRSVVTKRTRWQISVDEHRIAVQKALLIAAANAKRVAAVISEATDDAAAKAELMSTYTLTDEQAECVLDLPLRRLNRLSRAKLEEGLAKLEAELAAHRAVLADIDGEVKRQLHWLVKTHGDPRRTTLVDGFEEFAAVTAKAADDVVCVGQSGKVKVYDLAEFRTVLRRGTLRDRAFLIDHCVRTRADDEALMVFADGSCRLAESRLMDTAVGQVDGLVGLFSTKLTAGKMLLFVLTDGRMRKVPMDKLRVPRGRAAVVVKDVEPARLLCAVLVDDDPNDVVTLATRSGYIGRFSLNSFTPSGMTSRCVPTNALPEGDEVVDVCVSNRVNDQSATMVLLGVDTQGRPLWKAVPLAETMVKGRTARALPYVKGKAFGELRRVLITADRARFADEQLAIHELTVADVPVLRREAAFAEGPTVAGRRLDVDLDRVVGWLREGDD